MKSFKLLDIGDSIYIKDEETGSFSELKILDINKVENTEQVIFKVFEKEKDDIYLIRITNKKIKTI